MVIGPKRGFRQLNQKGLSLLEAVVAVAIIGLVVVPVLGMFNAGLYSDDAAARLTAGSSLAQAKIEELRYGPASAVVSQAWQPVPDYAGYQLKVDVVPVESRLNQVTVTVSWTSARGSSKVELTTLIAGK